LTFGIHVKVFKDQIKINNQSKTIFKVNYYFLRNLYRTFAFVVDVADSVGDPWLRQRRMSSRQYSGCYSYLSLDGALKI
jgi:hypothetical protein